MLRNSQLIECVRDHEKDLKERKDKTMFDQLFDNRKAIEERMQRDYSERAMNQAEIEELEQKEIEMIMRLQRTQKMQQSEVEMLEKVLQKKEDQSVKENSPDKFGSIF